MTEPRVGRAAYLLGFAGLLPQVAAVGWMLAGARDAWLLATFYGLAILSFLGGTWWSFAMRASDRQPLVAAIAVVPSLVAVALAVATVMAGGSGWVLVAIGSALLLTLLADRWLLHLGLTPVGWMRLRVPLSVGLGLLTIAAGALSGS